VMFIAGAPAFLVPPVLLGVFGLAVIALRRVWHRTANSSPA